MTEETFTKLDGLLTELGGVQRAEARISDAIDAIRCECDHKFPDGTSAVEWYNGEDVYCKLCDRFI